MRDLIFENQCGVAKLVRRLIVNQETRRFESGPHSHLSGSRLDGKPPALGAGESEFDSRDPDLMFEMGTWSNGMTLVLQTGSKSSILFVSTIVRCRGREDQARVS